MADVYITKSDLEGLVEVRVDGRSPLDAAPAIRDALKARLGRDVAALLAEPVVTRGNGQVATSISWYGAREGQATPLPALEPPVRAGAEALLRDRLGKVAGLLADPEIGPLLGGALHIASPDDILVIDGQPVITRWGLVPEAAMRSPDARDAHFAATLGPYLGLEAAPPLDLDAWRARYAPAEATAGPTAAAAAAVGAAAGAGVAGAAMAGQAGASAPPVPPAAPPPGAGGTGGGRRRGHAWLPVAIACVVAALVLLYILLPGVLIYPPERSLVLDDGQALALQRDINQSLEERRRALQSALEENACTVQGELLPPRSGDGAGPISPQQLVAPPPSDLAVPDPATEQGQPPDGAPARTLADLLDAATVLVIAPSADQQSLSTGTGFFISPNTVVTNAHVIDEAGPDIFVTSEALHEVHPARLLSSTGPPEIGRPDFALLQVEDVGSETATFVLSPTIAKLDNVIASGFPDVILETDVNYRALLGGDAAATPALTAQSGAVTVVQTFPTGTEIIIHSADISPGNSGGPLVDSCGRVVGVNTFVNPDQQGTLRRLNYALHTRELQRFLDGAGVPYSVAEAACQPMLARAPDPPPAPGPVEPPQPQAPGPEEGVSEQEPAPVRR